MAFLDARAVSDLDLEIPPVGEWMARLRIVGGDMPAAGPATLRIGDLSAPGRVLADRGGLDAPAQPAVVVAGGRGWRTRLPRGAYASPTGVRLSTVLADLARLTGETPDVATEARLGAEYGWDAGTTGRAVLADLVARGAIQRWRVDILTGRTVFTDWPARGPADARGTIESRDLAAGLWRVALVSDVAAWLPGATVQGVAIRRLVLRERRKELRAEARAS